MHDNTRGNSIWRWCDWSAVTSKQLSVRRPNGRSLCVKRATNFALSVHNIPRTCLRLYEEHGTFDACEDAKQAEIAMRRLSL